MKRRAEQFAWWSMVVEQFLATAKGSEGRHLYWAVLQIADQKT